MLLAVLLLLAGPSDRPLLPPVDQCSTAPRFMAFQRQLAEVIARKDVVGLLDLTDERIQLNFGGDSGRKAMRRIWGLDKPATSKLWAKLSEVMRLGCAVTEQGVAVVPSMIETLPATADAFETVVVVKAAILRAAPDEKARPIEMLSWDLLTAKDGIDETSGWTKVALKDGRTGFVRSSALRSPIDYRATFELKTGRWRMTAFVAGD
jgi:hypothetical protein